MPNIMLTYRCNLQCPYCFANEFVNRQSADISRDHFEQALDFITKSGFTKIGLIGGEPLLHPDFAWFMQRLIDDERVKMIQVYTNGLLMDRYLPLLCNSKVYILVNCNQPEQLGAERYEQLHTNLDALMARPGMRLRADLGINLYRRDMEYDYILALLKRLGLHRVRISVVVPDFSKEKNVDIMAYFSSWKPTLLKLFAALDKIQVLPYYDCNKPPYCIWTEEEKAFLQELVGHYPVKESNLIGHHSFCNPVIDILPDLRAVRCFGMSDFEKVSISDFNSIEELIQYFITRIDTAAYRLSAAEDCRACRQRLLNDCAAGCMGFKWERIQKFNQVVEQL